MKSYSRCSSPNKHRPLKRSEFFFQQKIEHLVLSVQHEADVIEVVVDPYLVPFATIQFAFGVYDQFPCGASIECEIES